LTSRNPVQASFDDAGRRLAATWGHDWGFGVDLFDDAMSAHVISRAAENCTDVSSDQAWSALLGTPIQASFVWNGYGHLPRERRRICAPGLVAGPRHRVWEDLAMTGVDAVEDRCGHLRCAGLRDLELPDHVGVNGAVARALRLDNQERAHLSRLARPGRRPRRPPTPERVRPLRHLLDAMSDAAAFVIGRRTDVLAWNRLGAALIADSDELPVRDRTFARLMFRDERALALFADWPAKARDLVSFLRMDAGRHPDDPAAELVGALSVHSEAFRDLWAQHPRAGQRPVRGRFGASGGGCAGPLLRGAAPARRPGPDPHHLQRRTRVGSRFRPAAAGLLSRGRESVGAA